MDPLVVFVGAFLLIFVVLAGALGAWHPRTGRQIVGRTLRDHGAEAEIEAHDIDEMIEAQNAIRRRAGRPEVGDELAGELRRRPPAP